MGLFKVAHGNGGRGACETPLDFCWHQHFSLEISLFCYIKKLRYRLQLSTKTVIIFTFFESIKIVLTDMLTILMKSAKWSTSALLKMKVFWNKSYGVIIPVHDVTNKILSHDSNYIVDYILDVVTWPKLGNSNISRREVIINSIL